MAFGSMVRRSITLLGIPDSPVTIQTRRALRPRTASRNAWYGYPCDTEIIFLCEFTTSSTQEASTAFQVGLNPPDDLKGTWYLSSESLTAYPAFQAAPLDEHQPTLAFVDALNLRLTLEATTF